MSKLVGLLAAVVLGLVAILDVAIEGRDVIGIGPVVILLVFGILMWVLLGSITPKQDEKSGLSINLALWLHSLLEGALAALSFSFGLKAGLIVSAALLIHLIPECLAIIAILRQQGFGYRYALRSYLISVVLLFTSFGLFNLLPQVSESLLIGLSTVVAGGFIYLATTTARKSFSI